MVNIIKYVAFYSDSFGDNENRLSTLSAKNKIDYISSSLTKNNYKVKIVSPSWTNNISGFYKSDVRQMSEFIYLKTFATFGCNNKFVRIFKYTFSLIQLFFYLLFNTEKDELVIVYHSVLLSLPIRLAKFFKKFKLILEVEEIYQDAQPLSINRIKDECDVFANADKYILSTELLSNKLNSVKKPYITINGTYQVEEDRKCKINDGKIHVVYAGTFDPRKGGALAAVASAEYLTKNYHVHIIGFGSIDDTNMLLKKIDDISKKSEATVTYDGLLSGEEYIQFLQKCDIGLSTQIPEAAYNESSFPSKILSYMANGLRVVSIRIKAIELSEVGQAIYYYDKPDPQVIANAIKSININETYDSREIIRKLDESFVTNIKNLLEG